MVSNLAMSDIEALEARGVSLTPQEIIRLNALALRATHSATASDITACPRIGWAGDVPIHEPTIAADIWVDTYAARWFEGDEFASALLFACANATVGGFFTRPELMTAAGTRNAMREWKTTLNATADQLRAALEYAMTGNDPTEGETAEKKKTAEEEKPQDPSTASCLLSQVDYAIAASLGIPIADIMLLTGTRLISILRWWRSNKGERSYDRSSVQAHADYARTLAAIIAAHPLPDSAPPGLCASVLKTSQTV